MFVNWIANTSEKDTARIIHRYFGQSDYPQDTPGYPRTPQDSIICMFNILYERVDDGLVLVCWCIN